MKMIERTTSHEFDLVSKYQPAGDQPEAIHQLVDGVVGGKKSTDFVGSHWDR
jgi:excinuclease ABC subunit B